MKHLDEGTIHAWLDGALDPGRSAELESHAAGCAQCSAAIAEARGLIAGASRILTALDDVPGGVVPQRKPATRRQWRAAPWVSGIAAALVLAVGISTWRTTPFPREAGVAGDTAGSRAKVTDAPAQQTPVVSAAPETAQSLGTTRSVSPASIRTRAVRDEAKSVAPAIASVGAGAADAAGAAEAERAAEPPRMLVAKTQDSERSATADLAGCYPMGYASLDQRSVANEASGRAALRRVAPAAQAPSAAAPAPASVSRSEFAARPTIFVRLDTVSSDRGFVVRALSGDSIIGWWSRLETDSVSVELRTGARLTLSENARADCPPVERP